MQENDIPEVFIETVESSKIIIISANNDLNPISSMLIEDLKPNIFYEKINSLLEYPLEGLNYFPYSY